jgi:hypothetical protein
VALFTNLTPQFIASRRQNRRFTVCGGTQDNWSFCGPSRTMNRWGIRTSDWFVIAGGDGFQSRNDPEDPNIVYASSQDGNVSRLDLRTGVSRSIRPPQSRGGRGGGGDDAMGGAQAGAAGARGVQGGQAGAQAGGGRQGAAATGSPDRANWDAPYIISPHSAKRLYWASNRLYRSDDRGDTWTAVSGDLSRNLNRDDIPIMVCWPTDSVARNTSTTALSNIVTVDESPLLEGLIYVGTDDGLVQVTEDGGKNWRKIEQFPGVPQWTYDRRVRFPARKRCRLRHAEQLAARRLQALHREERGPWAHLDEHHGRSSGPARLLVDRPGPRQRQPAVRRYRIRPVRVTVDGSRGVELKAACRPSRCAT